MVETRACRRAKAKDENPNIESSELRHYGKAYSRRNVLKKVSRSTNKTTVPRQSGRINSVSFSIYNALLLTSYAPRYNIVGIQNERSQHRVFNLSHESWAAFHCGISIQSRRSAVLHMCNLYPWTICLDTNPSMLSEVSYVSPTLLEEKLN
jgi:hypothetical protein